MAESFVVERRIKQHKLLRKARRGEILIRRIYKLIRFLIIVMIFYSIYRIGHSHYWNFTSDVYSAPLGKHIEILGNNIVSNEKILNKMKEYSISGKPIYKFNPAKMANSIEQLPPVKRAYIRRFWFPARLVVMIEEVVPAIIVAPSEDAPAVAAFSFSGDLIGREYLPLSPRTNTIKILSYGTKGDDYEKWDSERINSLYNFAALIKEYSGENVLYIDLRKPHSAYVQLENIKLKIGEIDTNAFERIKSLPSIMPEAIRLGDKIQYVDLSWKESRYIKLNN